MRASSTPLPTRLRGSSSARVENHFGETNEEKHKEPFIPLHEGTLYGSGALQKIFLPSSRQARPPSPVHLRRRGMPACPAYPVIRNNAAPFPFHTIPIPSVHDTGWHVRVYEASSTVKRRCPSVSANVPMSSGALPPADTSNGNSLITFIFITLHRPSGRFSGI